MLLKLWNYWNISSIIIGFLIAMLSGFSAYFLFKLDSAILFPIQDFFAHFLAIFISATLLLKYAAEKGYAVFSSKNLIFIAVPVLVVSLILFASGVFLMIFIVDTSLVMLAFAVAYKLMSKG